MFQCFKFRSLATCPFSLKGWVQSIRIHKNVAFMQLHNGNESIQIVIDNPNQAKNIHTGSSVEVNITSDPTPLSAFQSNTNQSELHATSISIIGPSPPQVIDL